MDRGLDACFRVLGGFCVGPKFYIDLRTENGELRSEIKKNPDLRSEVLSSQTRIQVLHRKPETRNPTLAF